MISWFVFCSLNVSLPRPLVNILAWHLKAFDNGKCGCTKLSQFTGNMHDLRTWARLGCWETLKFPKLEKLPQHGVSEHRSGIPFTFRHRILPEALS